MPIPYDVEESLNGELVPLAFERDRERPRSGSLLSEDVNDEFLVCDLPLLSLLLSEVEREPGSRYDGVLEPEVSGEP